jgi:hypothetical protein
LEIERRAFLTGAGALLAGSAAAHDYKDPTAVAAEPNPPRWPDLFALWMRKHG